MRPTCLLAMLASLILPVRSARAWNYQEHLAIGQEGYLSACNGLATRPEIKGLPAQDVRYRRFVMACAPGLLDGGVTPPERRGSPRSFVYGQAVAISGDLLSTPQEFFSALGGEHVLSTGYYFSLALVNSSHFHPQSIRRWREFHVQAIEAAVEAAHALGVDQEQKFERAFYLSAFAQHFLQDSFAAGHMGFNRPASSAAASYRFHQRWNQEGRLVRNERGNIWTAYGDGLLLDKRNDRNRQLVLEAATDSAAGLLLAFINGQQGANNLDTSVTNIIPSRLYSYDASGGSWIPDLILNLFSHEAPDFNAFRMRVEAVDGGGQAAVDTKRAALAQNSPNTDGGKSFDELYLRAATSLHNRAFKDWGVNVSWIYGGRRFSEAGYWQAIVPELNMRFFTDALRVFVGFGYVYKPSSSAGGGFGLKYQLGTSVHGLVTHELSFENWARYTCVECNSGLLQHFMPRNSLYGAGYKISGELGPVILGLEAAPALVFENAKPSFGYYTGATLEVLFAAAGGGPL
jgi:hypothetical protein